MRSLVRWLLVLGMGVSLVVAAQATQYHEAPMLHELVVQGKLPPVEQRLPKNPKIIEPYVEIGQYGGTLLRVYTGPADYWNYRKFSGDAYLIRLNPELEPNIVDHWYYEDEGRTLVLHFREGVKWSDGEPLTVDDFIYLWDLRLNPDYPHGISAYMRDPAGKVATLEKIDDFTIKIHYSVPYPLAIYNLKSEFWVVKPKHWLIQFDPRYNPDVKDFSLLDRKTKSKITPDLVGQPVLGAWMITEYTPGVQVVAERNPYYWKVDTAGNQLPYIDRIIWQYVGSLDVIPLMAAAGKIDMQARKLSFADYTFYKQNEEKGGYHVQIVKSGGLGASIQFNYDCPDPVLRDLIRNKDFRIALSYATNREEISRVFYKGLAEPWGYCPLPESPFYPGDEYAKMYTEYDPVKANAILDQLGLKDTDGNGIRNRPDGKDLSIVIDYSPKGGEIPYTGLVELIVNQWEKVGVKVIPNPMDRALLWPRLKNGDFEAYVWKVDGGIYFFLRPEYWLPVTSHTRNQQMYKSAGDWFVTGGKEGEKPAEQWILQAQDLYRELLQTIDPTKQSSLGRQIAQLVAENCYQIATTTMLLPCVISNKIGNVPDHWVYGDVTRSVGVIRPWQFFIKGEK